MKNESTTKEILSAVHGLSEKMDKKFIESDSQFDDVKFAVNGLSERMDRKFTESDSQFDNIKLAVTDLSAKMDSKFIAVDNKIEDILVAINGFAEDVQIRFEKIEHRLDKHDSMFTQMVTKEYLDDKLADLEGKLIGVDKKADSKSTAIVHKLQKKKILNKSESEEIITMSPFPRLNS